MKGQDARSARPSSLVTAIRTTILRIPKGKVATYGQIAEAAGYPGYHRQVAQVLNRHGHGLPWHRVISAGGFIKTPPDAAADQRLQLQMEGVHFRGRRVDMARSGWLSSNRRSS